MSLDRNGIATAIRDFLVTDTTVLYGSARYLQMIIPKAIEFTKARVNNNNPNALYIWVESLDPVEERIQNSDFMYTVDLRFESLFSNPETGSNNIDNSIERVNYLINTEIRNGNDLSSYYSDSNAQIIDMAPMSSTFPSPVESNGRVIVEIEGAISILVNRWQ